MRRVRALLLGGTSLPIAAAAWPAIAATTQLLSVSSAAINLVANPANGGLNTYVRDLRSGHVTLVSVGAGGAPADHSSLPAFSGISATGRFVAYASNSDNIDSSTGTGHLNLFFYDLARGVTELVRARSSTTPRTSGTRTSCSLPSR